MRRLGRLGVAPAIVAVLALTGGTAIAYEVTAGGGSGNAKVTSLSAPSVTKATPAGTSVELGWSAVTAPGTGTVTYYVTRDGGAPAGNCPTSSSPTSVTSCTDTGLSPGSSHSYTVTAVWRSWSAQSAVREAVIAKKAQTIKFTSTAPSKATVGEATYKVTAEASSKLAVSLSSASESVCTLSSSVSGATVTIKAGGTCVIDATQAGSGEYEAAPQEAQQFTVKKTQTIKFTSTAPSKATLGGATYTVTAIGGASAQPVTLSVAAGAKAVCSLAGSSSGSSVSFTGVGTCTIDANQAGNGEYEAAPQEDQSFSVGKGAQSIKFNSTAPSKATIGESSYEVSATASSGLAIALESLNTSICTVSHSTSPATVTTKAAGTCQIKATQTGNESYEAAPAETQSFAVAKRQQTITFSTAPSKAIIGERTYRVTAEASSKLAVTLESENTSVCTLSSTLSGATVTTKTAGTCTIVAKQAGSSEYEAVQEEQEFTVFKKTQTIKFSTPPSNATVNEDTYQVSAEASSRLTPVTLESESTSICTLATLHGTTTVDMKAAGTCVIVAQQAGNGEYEAVREAQDIIVHKKAQTIRFTSAAPTKALVGEKAYRVTAEASSKLAVTLESENTSVCTLSSTLSDATVTMKAPGTCVIVASQAGSGEYEAAQEEQEFEVGSKFTLAVEGSGTSYSFSGAGTPGATVTVDVCKDDEASCKHLEGSALTTTVASTGLWSTGAFTFKALSTFYADASEASTGETAGPLKFTTGG